MYQLGHYGAALLAYAPLGALVALSGHEPAAVGGGLVCLACSTLPDCDHRVPLLEHRGPTHTVAFALLVGAALAAVTGILVDATPAGLAAVVAPVGLGVEPAVSVDLVTFAFVVGALSIGSHLLADALTPMGIRPFWPVSRRHYTLEVTRAANAIANYVLLGLGLGAAFAAAAVVAIVG